MDKEILELLKSINSKLDEHTQILNEHTQILRALEHASESHKAEIDRVNHAIARVEGEIKGIREDLTAVELMTSKNWNDIVKLKAVK
ncbi:hypothetical protein [Fonticella tunisiensis]|uniref:Uncharacterized protein n=1 Tax=Fonticella tunisiensis TaxID=1096341 RepID=A0A4R7KAU4_9CLOT|nr:hypothetical protein [Fonticella tunisiensis]TDT52003.1 hypothetical protein EDD71_11534 [Fonticella tunisiensis]